MVESKLFKTKLCQLYQRGRCPRPRCKFAHGSADLRRSFDGRDEYSGSRDLRERLDRTHSPLPKSPEMVLVHLGKECEFNSSIFAFVLSWLYGMVCDINPRKRKQLDDHTDYSGRMSNETEGQTKDRKQTSSDTKIRINEQLREMHSEIKKLKSDKRQLELYLVDKAMEADTLTLKIHELEMQLSKEKEQAERYNAKMKKFIKAHNHHMRLQDDLKRSHAKLRKLGEQLDPDVAGPGIEDDLRINTISDDKTGGSSPDEGQINYSPPRERRSRVLLEAQDASKQVKTVGERADIGNDGVEKLSRKSRSRNRLRNSKKPEADVDVYNEREIKAYEDKSRREIINQPADIASADKYKVSETDLVMPSTGIAAHAIDEEVDAADVDDKFQVAGAETDVMEKISCLPFLPPPLPPIPPNVYLQYKGDDKNVDIDGVDEMAEVDVV
ncbi:zinc finger CCCH domain-containing protein 40 [Phtheirospermum japonicum]|uniref:Zinc finger CCCH domain-containing protein 40 n=1 Tax=Phtheirospermum japonicum TaxID=374723 RepID=A0A830AYG2_9LAMI|nr:zinc finger CCCH domain-containing protein 40 [Phtheirospermum japonicum]